MTFPILPTEGRAFANALARGVYCDAKVSELVRDPKRIAEIIYGEPLTAFDLVSAQIHNDDDIAELKKLVAAKERAKAALEIMIGKDSTP